MDVIVIDYGLFDVVRLDIGSQDWQGSTTKPQRPDWSRRLPPLVAIEVPVTQEAYERTSLTLFNICCFEKTYTVVSSNSPSFYYWAQLGAPLKWQNPSCYHQLEVLPHLNTVYLDSRPEMPHLPST
jgi:hypothetical protein